MLICTLWESFTWEWDLKRKWTVKMTNFWNAEIYDTKNAKKAQRKIQACGKIQACQLKPGFHHKLSSYRISEIYRRLSVRLVPQITSATYWKEVISQAEIQTLVANQAHLKPGCMNILTFQSVQCGNGLCGDFGHHVFVFLSSSRPSFSSAHWYYGLYLASELSEGMIRINVANLLWVIISFFSVRTWYTSQKCDQCREGWKIRLKQIIQEDVI